MTLASYNNNRPNKIIIIIIIIIIIEFFCRITTEGGTHRDSKDSQDLGYGT